MTKKTKEEKIIAAKRKKMKLLQQSTRRAENLNQQTPEVAPQILKPQEKVKETGEDQLRRTYFIKDLKKSLLVILLISALEIIIYFARINR
jgi:hypothetical protein